MLSAAVEFGDVMRAAGLQPPPIIEPGTLHRFPGVEKRNGNKAGWCKLFVDGMGGCFGDWSTGLSDSWQAKRSIPFTPQQREAFHLAIEEAKRVSDAERVAKQDDASKKAAWLWEQATHEPHEHAYLKRKGIQAHGVRVYKGSLLVPMYEAGRLWSLQLIAADAEKRFLSGGRTAGCSYTLGNLDDSSPICIAEGFATAASIHESTGYAVVVAFTASNLAGVTTSIRARLPNAQIILCADDDANTPGNPGLTRAKEAAAKVGGMVAVPDFGADRSADATDFNDMARALGKDAVRDCIDRATRSLSARPLEVREHNAWPDPLPLAEKITAEPYPLDALPSEIRKAVEEVRGFVKAPAAMVASSALAALSVAAQAYVNAKRAEKLSGPASLFLLTIADSGERKSTCDGFFMTSIRDYEAEQAEKAKPLIASYTADLEAWEAKRSGIKEKIRQLAKDGKPTSILETTLRDLEHEKPEPPLVPRLFYADATPEALAFGLAKGWPTGAVVSSEAGVVFGAHGMGKDSVMRNLALLNVLWDGTSHTIDRRTAESFTVQSARLTVALQVQDATLRTFFDRSAGLARGTGFLARFLVAWPESTQGSRWFTEAPQQWPALAAFNRRVADILARDIPIDRSGKLAPRELSLSSEAKRAWVAFHDTIEASLASGGELYDVRDVASKSADNAVRIAALFQYFADEANEISLESIEAGCRIAAWHLNEARRFYGELALPTELSDASHLDEWLVAWCKRHGTDRIARREIQRNITPVHLRQTTALDCALKELTSAGRLRQMTEGKRKDVVLSPVVLGSAK